MRGRGFFVAAAAAMLVWPCAAGAQEPQVTGLDGDPGVRVHHAQVEPGRRARPTTRSSEHRSTPTTRRRAPAVIVGVWQPQRTITPDAPAFAESGYTLGERYQWRVRARLGTANPQPYSTPVAGATLPHWGPVGAADAVGGATPTVAVHDRRARRPRTRAALDAASDRMRVVELARTLQNRPMNMFVIGYPKPPDTAAAISAMPTLRDQLQRPRQRGLRARVVLHDGPPAGAHRGPGDPGDAAPR